MNKYEKGELVTTTGSNDKKISWIATGDEQKDAAIEIQILEATKCLDWSYGRTNIENQTVDCSGLTAYLYELVGTEIPHTSRSRGEGSPGQYNSSNGTQIFNYNVNDADSIDWDSVPTGSILTFGDKGGHVAYYLGNGYILHALSTDEDVVISSVYDRTSDDSINQSDNGKYYTSTGMEIVSKKAYLSWDQQQKPLCYITTFEDSIYVDKNGNVIRPEMLDGNKLTPNGVIYGDTDIIIYADDNGISYIKENGEFIPISESVDAGASLNGIGDEIDSDNEFISHFKIIKSNVATAQTARVINYDPIILDLDGDGFNIESKENGSHFDLDNNGFAEKINWTSKDGFLCLDLNGNGAVDNGGELFGDNTLLADGTKAKNGFEALAQYDSNGDGVIDKNDEIFESLRIWVDADGSGTSSEGEMKTLSELGISGIKLNYTVLNGETGTEAVLGNMATFIREDGTEGSAAELWVSSDLFDTTETINVEISEEIAKLPDVRSIGNAHSLRTAMALDETGTLKGYVEEFVNSNNAAEKRQAVEKILYFICGAENIDSASRGGNMDARQLAVLETMLGENFTGVNGADPNTVAAPILKEAYNNLFNLYFTELIKETVLKEHLPLIRYSEDENGDKVINTELFDLVMDYTARQNEETASHIIGAASLYIDSLKASGYTYTGNFVEDYMKKSSTIAIGILGYTGMGLVSDGKNPLTGTASGEYLGGSVNNDEINAGEGDDILIGGKGDDILNGGKGCDTYVFNIGDGNDVVYDSHTYYYDARNDRIKFGEGITADSVSVRREDNNLIFEYGNGDMVTVKDHFASQYNSIEYVDFEGGTTWELAKLTDLSRVVRGTDGADELNGFTGGAYYNTSEIFYAGNGDDIINAYNGNDTIYAGEGNDIVNAGDGDDIIFGGKGDDILNGGKGCDTYVFNIGDGNDVVYDSHTYYYDARNDRIKFGEGITADSVNVRREDNNLIFEYGNGDMVTVKDHFASEYNSIEYVDFEDGTTWNLAKLTDISRVIKGTDGADELNGFTGGAYYNTFEIFYAGNGDDIINAYNGNDTIYAGEGNDTVNASDGDDIIYGGKGDDVLNGGTGCDTYVFNIGDGNDVVYDSHTYYYDARNDRIKFGEGITADSVNVRREDNNLIFEYGNGDMVTVKDHFASEYNSIEYVEFSNGDIITNNQIDKLIQAMASFEADSGMTWNEAIENNDKRVSDIITEMWIKTA